MAMVVITSVFKIFEKTMAFMDFLYTIGHNIFGLSYIDKDMEFSPILANGILLRYKIQRHF